MAKGEEGFDLRRPIAGMLPLVLAARAGEAEIVDQLLQRGADIDRADDSRWTPLLAAVAAGKPDVVRLLLQKGARRDLPSPDGTTPAVLAAATGSPTMIALLPGGIQPSSKTADVIRYILAGDASQLQTALANKGNPDQIDPSGTPALVLAAAQPKKELLAFLIAAGAKADTTPFGLTALMVAARLGYIENVRILLSARFSPLAKLSDGTTALDAARASGRPEVVEAVESAASLLDPALGARRLYKAAANGDQTAVQRMLSAKQAPNGAGARQVEIPLIIAAFKGHFTVVETLIIGGADVNIQDSRGLTPLMAAVLGGQKPAAEILLSRGANPLTRSNTGLDAMSMASAGMVELLRTRALIDQDRFVTAIADGDLATVKAALGQSRRPSIEAVVFGTKTSVLGLAISKGRGNNAIVAELLRTKASADGIVDLQQETPLAIATSTNNIEAVRLLLDAGANPLIKSNGGATPREIAKNAKNSEIEAILFKSEKLYVKTLNQLLFTLGYLNKSDEVWSSEVEIASDKFRKDFYRHHKLDFVKWVRSVVDASIIVCNSRSDKIYYSYALKIDKDSVRNRSDGWYSVDSGRCKPAVTFTVPNPSADVFIYAQVNGQAVKINGRKSGQEFCVHSSDGFTFNGEEVEICKGSSRKKVWFQRVEFGNPASQIVTIR